MTMAAKVGYRDVKREVFRRIRSNEWGPGALLPGEVELAAAFGCARATVNRAMQELSDDGIIDRRRKAGSRVRLAPLHQVRFEIPLVRAEVEVLGAAYGYHLHASAVLPAPDWLCHRTGLAAHTPVRHVQCLHLADAAPFQFEDRWINLAAVPRAQGADFKVTGPNEWLVAEVPYTNAEVRLCAAAASGQAAVSLSTAPGTPIFIAERTTWLADVPITHVRLHFAAGYQMVARY